MTMGADPIACAALAGGARREGVLRPQGAKAHGLQRRVEGPLLDARRPLPRRRGRRHDRRLDAAGDRGAAARRACEIVGVVAVLDRLAGGGERIEAAAGAPYAPLATIDDVYPDRPDR